jgi:hypothetical protein
MHLPCTRRRPVWMTENLDESNITGTREISARPAS